MDYSKLLEKLVAVASDPRTNPEEADCAMRRIAEITAKAKKLENIVGDEELSVDQFGSI